MTFLLFRQNSLFQYMLLLRGATLVAQSEVAAKNVSIHAPLARSNRVKVGSEVKQFVSIHAPLARSNPVSTGVC